MKQVLPIFIFIAFVAAHAQGQDIAVSGRVTSVDDGTALPGVNVP